MCENLKTTMEDASSECEEQFLFLSRDELFNAFEDFKKDTCTGWHCVFKDSKFGKFGKPFNNS